MKYISYVFFNIRTFHENSFHFHPGLFIEILFVISVGGSNVCAGYVPKTSIVTVQRAALNHLPQPFICLHRSKWTPFGFSRLNK